MHATIPKCIVGSSLFLDFSISGKSEKNGTKRHERMFVSAKRKQQKQVQQLQCQEPDALIISHIAFRNYRVRFSPKTFF